VEMREVGAGAGTAKPPPPFALAHLPPRVPGGLPRGIKLVEAAPAVLDAIWSRQLGHGARAAMTNADG